jgi:hypothetical protein
MDNDLLARIASVFLLDAGRIGDGRAIFFVRAQAFCAVFNQLVRSCAQLLFLE